MNVERILKLSKSNLSIKMIGVLSSLMFALVVVSVFGISDYGQYVYLFSLSSIASVLLLFGSVNLIYKYSSDIKLHYSLHVGDSRNDGYVSSLGMYSLYVMLMLIILAITLGYFILDNEGYKLLSSILFLSSAIALNGLASACLRVEKGVRIHIFYKEIYIYIIPVLTLPFLEKIFQKNVIVYAAAFGYLVTGAMALSRCQQLKLRWVSLKYFRRYLNDTYLYCLSGFVGIFLGALDILVGNHFSGNSLMGVYSLLKKIAVLINLPQALGNVSVVVDISSCINGSKVDSNSISLYAVKAARKVVRNSLFIAVFCLVAIPLAVWIIMYLGYATYDIEDLFVIVVVLISALLTNVIFGVNLLVASQLRFEVAVIRARMIAIAAILVLIPLYSFIPMNLIPCFVFFLSMFLVNLNVSRSLRKKYNIETTAFGLKW